MAERGVGSGEVVLASPAIQLAHIIRQVAHLASAVRSDIRSISSNSAKLIRFVTTWDSEFILICVDHKNNIRKLAIFRF